MYKYRVIYSKLRNEYKLQQLILGFYWSTVDTFHDRETVYNYLDALEDLIKKENAKDWEIINTKTITKY